VENKKENSLLLTIEKKLEIPYEVYRRLEFESGKEPYMNIGVSTKIIPYYAKLKYLLNPGNESSTYYLFSMGVNLIEDEEVALDMFIDDIAQRVNYGVGVGISLENLELEILYGKYNYENLRVYQQKDDNLYNLTRITFGCKYRF